MKFRVDSWIFNYQSSSERDDYLRENLSNFWKTPLGNEVSRPPGLLEGPWVKLPHYRREQQLYQEVITEYLSDTVKDLDEYISIQGPTFSLEDIPIPAPVGIPGKLDLGFTLISYENGFLHTGEKSRIAAGDFSPLSLFANREFIAPGNSLEVAWNPRLRFSSVALEGVGYGFEARHGEDIDGDGFGEYGVAIRGLLPCQLDVGFRLEPGSIIESIREDS